MIGFQGDRVGRNVNAAKLPFNSINTHCIEVKIKSV